MSAVEAILNLGKTNRIKPIGTKNKIDPREPAKAKAVIPFIQ